MYSIDLSGGLALALLGVIVAASLWWAWRVSQGIRFRPILLGLFTAGCVILFILIESGSWLGIEDIAPVDLGLFGLAAILAWLAAIRTTRILPSPAGEPRYKASPWLVVAWLALLLMDVFVQQWILGRVSFLHLVVIRGIPVPMDSSSVAHPYRTVLEIVDGLFALGTGLTLGTNLGVSWAYGRKLWHNHVSKRAGTA